MKEIKQIVSNLRGKYNTNNPYVICSDLNITVKYAELGTINGYYIQVPKHQMIYINNNLNEKQQTFVCAHELGHAIMHKGLNTFFLQNNTLCIKGKFENQANEFAAELIIDDNLLYNYQGFNLDTISRCEGIPIKYLNYKFNK